MAEPTPAPAPAADASAAGAAGEAEYRAELKRMLAADQEPAKEDAPPPKEEDADDESKADEAEGEPDEDAEAEEDEADYESEGDDTADEDEPEAKSKYSKALLKLQKKEAAFERHRAEVLAKERDLGEREKRLASNRSELDRFIAAARLDPVGTFEREGILSDDDKLHWAKQFHYTSGEAAKDPRSRVEAERLRRERDRDHALKQQQDKIDAFEKERETERAQAAQAAETDRYVTRLDATVEEYKAKTPLLAQALAKSPQKTVGELRRIAHDLSVAKGEWADPKLVVLAWAKERKELLATHGIAEPAAPPKKAKSKSAVEQKGPGNEPKKQGSSATNTPPKDETPEARAAREEREYRAKLKRMLAGEDVED